MGTDNVYGTPNNGDSVALTLGMVVRLSSNKTVVRAQADSTPHLQGLSGVVNSGSVAPHGVLNVVCEAFRQPVLLETGLTPVAGQTLYVSATVPGRATNVAPGTAVAIGTIEDVGNYATTSRVFAAVSIPATASGGSGAQGAQGFQGATGAQGSQGSQGAQGVGGVSQIIPGTDIAVSPSSGLGNVTVAFNAPTWSVLGVRVFSVRPTGNDANAGFADSPDLTSANIQAATVAAGLVAKQTIAGVIAAIPMNGIGMFNAIVVIEGATYADSLGLFNKVQSTYLTFNIRGTGTNATAGATAFAGDLNDLTYMGAVTGTGLFAAGYSSTAAVTSNILTLKQTDGGVPAFAMPGKPQYLRVRGDINNPTAATRNLILSVVEILSPTQVRLSANVTVTNVGGPDGTGDVFYIEQPGVVLTGNATLTNTAINFRGIQVVGSLTLNRSTNTTSFTNVTGPFVSTTSSVHNITTSYTTGTTTANCGPSRFESTGGINNGRFSANASSCGFVGSLSATLCATFSFLGNCWIGGSLTQSGGAGDVGNEGNTDSTTIGGGSTAVTNPPTPVRIDGALTLIGTRTTLSNINFPNTTSAFGVAVQGTNQILIRDVIFGGAKTNAGFDMSNSANTSITTSIGSLGSTITGANGDIFYGSNPITGVPGAYVPWAFLTANPPSYSFRFPNGDSWVSNGAFTSAEPPVFIAHLTMAFNPGPNPVVAGLVRGASPGDAADIQQLQADTLANVSGSVGCAFWSIGVGKTSFVSWGGQAQILWDDSNPGAGGTLAYVSPINPGQVTKNKPAAPSFVREVGWSDDENVVVITPSNVADQPFSNALYAGAYVNDAVFSSGTPQAEVPAGYQTVMNGVAWRYQFQDIPTTVKYSLNIVTLTLVGGGANFFVELLRNGTLYQSLGPFATGSTTKVQGRAATGGTSASADFYSARLRFASVTADPTNTLDYTLELEYV